MNHVGRLRREAGDLAGAAALVEGAHAMYDSILGPTHVCTTLTMVGLAQVRQAQGRTAEAESLLTAAVAARTEKLGGGFR